MTNRNRTRYDLSIGTGYILPVTLCNLWSMARAPDLERQAASVRMLAPLRPEWIASVIGVTRQTQKRWREKGIPEDRFAEVERTIREHLFADNKEAASPIEWARRLMDDARMLSAALGDVEAAEQAAQARGVDAAVAGLDVPPDGETPSGRGADAPDRSRPPNRRGR